MSWLLTCEGCEHHLAGPEMDRRDNVPTLGEIAHSLAQINRFNGHCSRPYSVAEHSLLVADLALVMGASDEVQLAALLHDAHECITGDVSTPIKHVLGSAWARFENRQAYNVAEHFRLLPVFREHDALIKFCDLTALATERRDLLPWNSALHEPWAILDTFDRVIEPASVSLETPDRAGNTWVDWADLFEQRARVLMSRAVPRGKS